MYRTYRHIAWKKIQFILLWIGVLFAPGIKANHVIGGEISYARISGQKYKFSAFVYRNCNECQFNTGNCADIKNLDILVSPEQSSTFRKVGNIVLTLKSKLDLTPTCRSYKSACNGGAFGEGIEKWEYTGEIDFDTITKDYCQFEIGLRIESRYNAYGTGTSEAFYNYARLNICNGVSNTSVVFQSPAYYLLAQNESFTYNLLASDPDGDSLSYKLVSANKGFATSVVYTGNFAAEYPVDIFCPNSDCTLNENSWPIEGVGINSETGWLGFTPTSIGQSGFLVIEVSEWRTVNNKKVKVGITRRDLQIKVIDAGNYAPKVFSSQQHYYVCAGEDLGIDVGVSDPQYVGIRDSVELFIVSELNGVSIQKVGSGNINQFDAFLSAKTTVQQARNKPYLVTIYARDNHCPIRITTYKTIEITLVAKPVDDGVIQYVKCNKVQVSSDNIGKDISHSWYLFSNNKMLDSRQSANAVFEVPAPGKYLFLHQIRNEITGCISERIDSIEVPNFSLLKQDFNWPEKVCFNEISKIEAKTIGGTLPFSYYWNGKLSANNYSFKIIADSLLTLRIIDVNGCELVSEKRIGIYSKPVISATDTSMCLPIVPTKINISNRYKVQPWYQTTNDKLYYSGFGSLLKINDQYYFEPSQRGVSVFEIVHLDTNSCTSKDTFSVKVIKAAKTNIQPQVSICSNAKLLDLNIATGNSMKIGRWYGATCIVDGKWLNPSAANSPVFSVYYENDTAGCIIRDTTSVNILFAPIASIEVPSKTILCESDADFMLVSTPTGGTWYDDALNLNGRVSPTLLGASGKLSSTYIYTVVSPTNGCIDKDTIALIVNPKVSLNVATDFSLCSGKWTMLSPKFSHVNDLKLTGDFSGIDVQRVDNQFKLHVLSDKRAIRNVSLTGSGLEGCSDVTKNITIVIKPVPVMTLTSSFDSGCVPLNFTLTAVSQNPNAIPTEIYWYQLTGWEAGKDTKSLLLENAGSAEYEIFSILEGCSSEIANKSIIAFPTPHAQLSITPESQTVTADYTLLTFENTTKFLGNLRSNWTFENGSPATSISKKVNVDFPADTGLYRVKLVVVSNMGCSTEANAVIRVKPSARFFAPNAFTPDSKGPESNEGFRLYMDSAISYRITIRNKWGEIVFKSETISQEWFGDYLGNPVPAGAYIWEMEAITEFGRQLKKSGTVVLIR